MRCQSECAGLNKTVNILSFLCYKFKGNENTYQRERERERALMQMYRVVPITKRGSFYEYTCEDSCEME